MSTMSSLNPSNLEFLLLELSKVELGLGFDNILGGWWVGRFRSVILRLAFNPNYLEFGLGFSLALCQEKI